jgi:hypothetical protein
MGYLDHEHRQIRTIVNWDPIDHHEILQAPILFGIAEIELDLEAQPLIVNYLIIGKLQGTTEEHDMSNRLGFQIGFHHHDNVEQIGEFLMP